MSIKEETMPATVTVKGKKKIIGKAIPGIIKQAELLAAELEKTVTIASNRHNDLTKAVRVTLEKADKALAKLKTEAQTVRYQVDVLKGIDLTMRTTWPKWYESGEKLWNKKQDDKKLIHADKGVEAKDKQAVDVLKMVKDTCANIGKRLDKLEAAVKGVIEKQL